MKPKSLTIVLIIVQSKKYRQQNKKPNILFRHRIPYEHWYKKLRPLLRILAHHEDIYQPEVQQVQEMDEIFNNDDDVFKA